MREWLAQSVNRLGAWCLMLVTLPGVAATTVAAPVPDRPYPSHMQPLVQHKTLEAVHVTLTADRQTMGIADRLRLRLSIEAPVDTRMTLPEVTDRLGPFTVLQHRSTGPAPPPQTQQWQQDYTLEAERTGELTIPGLTVAWQTSETVHDAAPLQINTDPMTITVTSVLPDDADVTAPRDITPPVALVRRGLPPWVRLSIAVLAGLGLLGAGIWWWHRRRSARTVAPPPPRPAHLLALEALRRLQRQDLIAQQRIEAFYVRVSDILRRYVEWRFGLRAPEQTTEEFLIAVLATGGLIATHRDLLDAFLAHCDLVKFARHQPTAEDMQQALERAEAFVKQTADNQVLVAVTGPGVAAL
ncbi:hypothetical protein NKDENANG_02390 [Candidatus Entotheonellaceae bacterium PAL068K]